MSIQIDLDYIAEVEQDLRTLWMAMEKSAKRINLPVQKELKSLRLQDKSKKIVARRLKKAYHTKMAVHWPGGGHYLPKP